MSKKKSLKHLLKKENFPRYENHAKEDRELEKLQLQMLRIQQGTWHQKSRCIVVFEGFDAAGKGGAIRRLTEKLDPRGIAVHPIGPPNPEDQAKHYLYRFWRRLPPPGTLAIFDRSWYGRVLVERVENLTPKARWKAAFDEINEFEKMLLDDGIYLIKIFLAISEDEQLRRFEDRLHDPYKQWKLTPDDVEAHSKWHDYVKAVDDVFDKTSTKKAPWHLIPANDKHFARMECLRVVAHELRDLGKWMETKAAQQKTKSLKKALAELAAKSPSKAKA